MNSQEKMAVKVMRLNNPTASIKWIVNLVKSWRGQ